MAGILAGASNFEISGGSFSVHNHLGSTSGTGPTSAFDKLSQATAHSALHDAPARTDESRCHQYTRVNVLDHLERRVQSVCNEDGSIFWLHGGAGAGKSAVMQTLAERCVEQGLALGSFFFSRSDPTRNTAEVLIATLLYQVAQLFPTAMDILSPVIDRDPLVFKKSFQVQCRDLFVPTLQYLVQLGHISGDPLTPRVFLVDGLDECNETAQQQAIIREMATVCHEHRIPIHILIASRPEHAISISFELYNREHPGLGTTSLSEDPDAEADIRRFVEDEFLKMHTMHPFRQMIPSKWPPLYKINSLVWKSSSHFIYASSAMKYIWTTKESPARSFDVILGLQRSRTASPFAELDSLYHHILGSAAHLDQVRAILAYCIFASLDSYFSVLCIMLECTDEDLSIFLADMGPLLVTRNATVRLRHQSLGDFLRDQSRSGVLYLSKEAYFMSSLNHCFQILSLLRQNQHPVPGQAVGDLDANNIDSLYMLLSFQIIDAAEKTLENSEIPELLKQYTLDTFHEFQLCFSSQYGLYYDSIRHSPASSVELAHRKIYLNAQQASKDLLSYLRSLISLKLKDSGFRLRSLEDFFDIFQSHLNLECKPLAAVIFPLLFSGYSTARICKILSTSHFVDDASPLVEIDYLKADPFHEKAMSFCLMNDFRHFLRSDAFHNSEYITSSDLASIRHSINSSPPLLTEAAEAILKYLPAFKPQWHSPYIRWASRATPHKLWLRTKKPGKHHSVGSPRLASRFHRFCLDQYDHCSTEEWYEAKQRKYLERVGLSISKISNREREMNDNSFNWKLVRALAWLLPKTNYSECIMLYSRRPLSQEVCWRYPQLWGQLRRSLDGYLTRVQEELSDRIHEGDLDALIKQSQMLQLNTLD